MKTGDTTVSNLTVYSYMQQNFAAIITVYYFKEIISKHQYSSQTSLLQIFLPEDSSLHLQSLSYQSKYPLLSKEINYSCHQSNNLLARQCFKQTVIFDYNSVTRILKPCELLYYDNFSDEFFLCRPPLSTNFYRILKIILLIN